MEPDHMKVTKEKLGPEQQDSFLDGKTREHPHVPMGEDEPTEAELTRMDAEQEEAIARDLSPDEGNDIDAPGSGMQVPDHTVVGPTPAEPPVEPSAPGTPVLPSYFTVQQVAEVTGSTDSRVRTVLEEGLVPGAERGEGTRGQWRVPSSQVSGVRRAIATRFAPKPPKQAPEGKGPQRVTPGRVVVYETDRRGGRSYRLAAIVACTRESHPDVGFTAEELAQLPANPVPIPPDDNTVHLTVFTPGGGPQDSGTYVELNVPMGEPGQARTWHWPQRA